jgi:hypothetical protein
MEYYGRESPLDRPSLYRKLRIVRVLFYKYYGQNTEKTNRGSDLCLRVEHLHRVQEKDVCRGCPPFISLHYHLFERKNHQGRLFFEVFIAWFCLEYLGMFSLETRSRCNWP